MLDVVITTWRVGTPIGMSTKFEISPNDRCENSRLSIRFTPESGNRKTTRESAMASKVVLGGM
jgi:hypothetical protein